jgi:hypothetical protein
MNISWSRWLTILAAFGATATAIAGQVDLLNHTASLVLTILGIAIAAFNERIQGGLSKANDEGEL